MNIQLSFNLYWFLYLIMLKLFLSLFLEVCEGGTDERQDGGASVPEGTLTKLNQLMMFLVVVQFVLAHE
jgi:hypothetical protein